MQTKNRSLHAGFTLIELMVVVAIIAIFTSASVAMLTQARASARVARAQHELKAIEQAMLLLQERSSAYPSTLANKPEEVCDATTELYLDTPQAGLVATDGNFRNWGGPYLSSDLHDPWGTLYYFDADYQCGASTLGCQQKSDLGLDSIVIESFGPNKTQDYGDGDDIVQVLCRKEGTLPVPPPPPPPPPPGA